MTKQFDIKWIDRQREPRNRANPAFPNGIHIDLTPEAQKSGLVRLTAPSPDRPETCLVDLPYPAKRCGAYMVHCQLCGMRVAVTTAGRADDPKTVRLGCKISDTKQ